MTTALVWLFFVGFFVVQIAVIIVNKKYGRWNLLSHFVRNYVGGKLAICSVTDYKSAKEAGITVGGKIMVKEITVFDQDRFFHPLSPLEFVDDLFVPFTSERLMSFDDQKKFFIVSQNPQEFAERKKLENMREDYRLRFVAWYDKNERKIVHCDRLSVLGILIMCIAGALIVLNAWKVNTLQQETMVYTTDANGIHETKMTVREARKLPVTYERQTDYLLTHGKVSIVQPISAGLSITCITRDSGESLCSFASSTIKVGEEAFQRSGKVTASIMYDNSRRSNQDWIIGKKEADALVATGKFIVVN